MKLGVFAKTYNRPTVEAILDAVAADGLTCVQFNLLCAGLPTLPDALDSALVDRIRAAHEVHGITMAAISGTFNLIHPDSTYRADMMRRLRVLASACGRLGTPMITLCTGTRDPDNMWRWHPDNHTPDAWRDLIESMRQAVAIADEFGVLLGVEPESANIIDSPKQARRLLDELGSPRVKIVIDGANLFQAHTLSQMGAMLDEAFELLSRDIALAHAKEIMLKDGRLTYGAPGMGVLDWAHYLGRLKSIGYDGALIMHSLDESEVEAGAAYLRGLLA